jgi:trehalose-phosphatase
MKYLLTAKPPILEKFRNSKPLILMLDFDGTLSPIALSPDRAKISGDAKTYLKKLARKITVAIISGRSLSDLKKKVGLKNIIYAGNHGLEWEIGGKISLAPVPRLFINVRPNIHDQLVNLSRNFKGAFVENKDIALALHYRLVNNRSQSRLKKQAASILKPYAKILNIINGRKVIDILPKIKGPKGRFALELIKSFEINPEVIYVGDDETDEDAFKALRKYTTVRVGKKNNSNAQYFVKSTGEVEILLKALAAKIA